MDLNELVQITTPEAHKRAFLKDLTDAFAGFSKPVIAAVVGYAVCFGISPPKFGCISACCFRVCVCICMLDKQPLTKLLAAWRRLRDCPGCECRSSLPTSNFQSLQAEEIPPWPPVSPPVWPQNGLSAPTSLPTRANGHGVSYGFIP
jgi:hypothetical protein